jgi:hypothetical protein
MTKQEKKRLSTILRATEYLFLENIALKFFLDHREGPKVAEALGSPAGRQRKERMAGVVGLKFRDVYDEMERSRIHRKP